MIDAAPGTIVVFSDLACPWSHLTVHRLHEARRRLGLDVRLDHRAFPLEIVNGRATPRGVLDVEVRALRHLEPEAGWRDVRSIEPWPVTVLLALEAVEAAKEQSLEVSEVLDRHLRRAFFARGRCISMRHVVLEAAAETELVDVPSLAGALDDGRARRPMLEHHRVARNTVRGSPHLFFADGTDVHNPGVTFHWEGEPYESPLLIDSDEAGIYDSILQRAAAAGEVETGSRA